MLLLAVVFGVAWAFAAIQHQRELAEKSQQFTHFTELMQAADEVIHQVQQEQHHAVLWLVAPEAPEPELYRMQQRETRTRAQQLVQRLLELGASFPGVEDAYEPVRKQLVILDATRVAVRARELSLRETVQAYTDLNLALHQFLRLPITQHFKEPFLNQLLGLHSLILLREQATLEQLWFQAFFTLKQPMGPAELEAWMEARHRQEWVRNNRTFLSESLRQQLQEVNGTFAAPLAGLRKQLLQSFFEPKPLEDLTPMLAANDTRLERLMALEEQLQEDLKQQARATEEAATQFWWGTVALILLVVVGLLSAGNALLRRSRKRVMQVVEWARLVAQGKPLPEIPEDPDDEFREIIKALKTLDHNLLMLSQQAEQILAGNLSFRVPSRSEQDRLAETLNQMATSLQATWEKVLEEKAQVDRILESLSDPLFVVSSDSYVTRCNPAAKQLLGYEEGEVPTLSLAELFSQMKSLEQLSATDFLKTKDGRHIPVLVSAAQMPPGKREDPEPQAAVIVAKDVSDLREAQREQLKLLRALEQSRASVVITDTDGIIEYVNPYFCQISGYSAEEAIGENPRVLRSGHHSEDYYRDLWETISGGATWRGELHNRHKEGTFFWEDATITPVRNRGGEVINYIAIKEDITQRKALEEELSQYRQHLEELVDARTAELQQAQERLMQSAKLSSLAVMGTGMAHEVNQPLAYINGLLFELQEDLENNELKPDAVLLELQEAQRQVQRISKILQQLRSLGQERGLEFAPCDLPELWEEAVSLSQGRIAELQVEVQRTFPDDLPPISGDAMRLMQMLHALIQNALDSMESATVRTLMVTGRALPTSCVELVVQDSGSGIPEAALPKVFDPFFTTKAVGEGQGLGLAMAYGLVANHRGQIECQSTEGEGTRILIRLPISQEVDLRER